ncbi:MAG TPA: hypothetical protein VJ884_07090, partial [Salinibacter sp.]|nr:hypothetical protein [Salinibacter sp.]
MANDNNTPDSDTTNEPAEASTEEAPPDLEMPDAEAPSPEPDEAVEGPDEEELPVEELMHGDGHAAIPEIPSLVSDGSIEIDE